MDVDYRDRYAVAACVVFDDWGDAAPAAEHVEFISPIAEYEPGQFYKRELPCLLAVLQSIVDSLSIIIVDGYVHLDDKGKPGLGAYLYDALDKAIPVIGVAKNYFHSATHALTVTRGDSEKPLYITAAGMSKTVAADRIRHMHGEYRIPTLLKRVDTLCRQATYSEPQ